MKKIKNWVATLSAVVVFIFSGYHFIDTKYAHAKEVKELKGKITKMELEQTYHKALDNYYNIKALSKKYPSDGDLDNQLIKASEEVEFLKLQLAK